MGFEKGTKPARPTGEPTLKGIPFSTVSWVLTSGSYILLNAVLTLSCPTPRSLALRSPVPSGTLCGSSSGAFAEGRESKPPCSTTKGRTGEGKSPALARGLYLAGSFLTSDSALWAGHPRITLFFALHTPHVQFRSTTILQLQCPPRL